MTQLYRMVPLALGLALGGVSAALAFGGGEMPAPPIDFGAADTDKDGKLTRAELDAWRQQQVAAMDADKDGFVSAAEMKAAIIARLSLRADDMVERRIAAQDEDGDGRLSMAEMEAGSRADRLFGRIDTDGDGAISQAELEQARAALRRPHRPDGPPPGP